MTYDLPCKFETFSGVCMICGAEIEDECVVKRECDAALRRAMKGVADAIAAHRAPTMEEIGNVIQLRRGTW